MVLATFNDFGGKLGQPGGVMVMWTDSICPYRTVNLTDVAQALTFQAPHSSGPVFSGVTVASLLATANSNQYQGAHLILQGGVVIPDAVHNTLTGPLCVEQWPRTFAIPVIALIFITLLNDGTIISIAYDHVEPSKLPEARRPARRRF